MKPMTLFFLLALAIGGVSFARAQNSQEDSLKLDTAVKAVQQLLLNDSSMLFIAADINTDKTKYGVYLKRKGESEPGWIAGNTNNKSKTLEELLKRQTDIPDLKLRKENFNRDSLLKWQNDIKNIADSINYIKNQLNLKPEQTVNWEVLPRGLKLFVTLSFLLLSGAIIFSMIAFVKFWNSRR